MIVHLLRLTYRGSDAAAAALVTLSTKKSGWGFVFVILFIREHHDAGVTSSYLSLCVVECNAKGEKISRSEQ